MHTWLRSFWLPAIALSLFACNAGTDRCVAVPAPAIAFAGPILVYPAPGATGVPDNIAELVIALTPPPGVSPGLLLEASGQSGATGLTQVVAPPSPIPTPTGSHPVGLPLHGVVLPGLSPATTYTVLYQALQTFGGCPPPPAQVVKTSMGSFTTK
jgi:hypothetical protein